MLGSPTTLSRDAWSCFRWRDHQISLRLTERDLPPKYSSSESDNGVTVSVTVELSDPSYERREGAHNERVGDDGGGEAFWLKRMSPELSELATIVAVVVGGKEEGGRDDMADSQKKRPTVSCCKHLPRPTPPPLTMPRCPSCSKILPSDEAVQ